MIALDTQIALTAQERSQLERKGLARGAWAEGRPQDALIILDTVLSEEMTPRVAVECYCTEAAFHSENKDWVRSLESLKKASEFIDFANPRVQGSFYHQRAKIHKELGNLDAALTDYAGAIAKWEGLKEFAGKPIGNIANIYLLLGDFQRAHEHVSRAIEIFTETGSPDLSQAYDTQANIYYAEGRLELALESIGKSLDIVGHNELWRHEFLTTQTKIRAKLLELLGVASVKDCDRIQINLVKEALVRSGGAFEEAGKEIGMSRKGVEYLVDHKDELREFRKAKRLRRKSIIKLQA